jgi:hypothetical protein
MSKLNKKQLKDTVIVIVILTVCLMADSIMNKIVNLIF